MPFPLVPLIAGAASLAGGWLANKGNKNEAEKNRDFQEHMSNTAVQRSIDDIRKAGLNPALAYDRSASSPTGTSAQIGDVLGPAARSASDAAQRKQDMRIADEMARTQTELLKQQAGAAGATNRAQTALAEKTDAELQLVRQNYEYQKQLNPKNLDRMDVENRATLANAMLTEFQLPGARNAASLESILGKWSPALKMGGRLAGDVIGLGKGGAAIFEAIKRGTRK